MAVGSGKLAASISAQPSRPLPPSTTAGQPVTLPNRDGDMLTPSAVLLEDGGAVVGQAALDVSLGTARPRGHAH